MKRFLPPFLLLLPVLLLMAVTAYARPRNLTNGGCGGASAATSANCAIELDGTGDYVDVADTAALDASTAMSIIVWAYPNTIVSQPPTYAAKGDYTGGDGSWFLDASGNPASVRFMACKTSACADNASISGPLGLVSYGTPYRQMAATFSSGTAKVYYQGADVSMTADDTFPASLPNSSLPFTAGARSNGVDPRDLSGRILIVRYYVGTVLTPDEIWADFNNGVPRSAIGTPTLEWRGGSDNSCTGSSVTDNSGNGHTGTLRGNAAFVATSQGSAIQAPSTCTSANAEVQIYGLLGQSNLSGRGTTGTGVTAANGPRIMLYGNDELLTSNPTEPIDSPTNQVAAVSEDAQAAYSPSLLFANSMAETWPNHRILLVPCAMGGTSSLDWTATTRTNKLYGSCIARMQAARNAAIAAGYTAEYGGLVVYQGEADTDGTVDTDQWSRRWRNGIERAKVLLSQPCLPTVYVRLPATVPAGYTDWNTIRANQLEFTSFPGVYDTVMAQSPDTAFLVDNIHLETAGQQVLGPRIATAMLTTWYASRVTP